MGRRVPLLGHPVVRSVRLRGFAVKTVMGASAGRLVFSECRWRSAAAVVALCGLLMASLHPALRDVHCGACFSARFHALEDSCAHFEPAVCVPYGRPPGAIVDLAALKSECTTSM